MKSEEFIYKTCLLLVEHFHHCLQNGLRGQNTRIFSYILHPEKEYVAIGRSQEVINGALSHPEHVVPCKKLITETFRLINKGMPKEEIAELLAKHWKIVYISKEQAAYLDRKEGLNLKHDMPTDWCFESGDTFARLRLANIDIFPLEEKQ
jgi:hypothetical protein